VIVPLTSVWCDPSRNPRGLDTTARIAALTRSVRAVGVVQPVAVVEEVGPGGERYRVVAGYGRFQAATACDLETLPVHVVTVPEGGEGELLIALAENEARAAIGPWSRCDAIGKLVAGGMPIDTVSLVMADEEGTKPMDSATVRRLWAISRLPQSVGSRLRPMGAIGFAVAKRLSLQSGLHSRGVWWPEATERATGEILAEMSGEPVRRLKPRDTTPRLGWRYRAATVRERSQGSDHPALMLANFLSGGDVSREDLDTVLGVEIARAIAGER
jgi:hypothetical protein